MCGACPVAASYAEGASELSLGSMLGLVFPSPAKCQARFVEVEFISPENVQPIAVMYIRTINQIRKTG